MSQAARCMNTAFFAEETLSFLQHILCTKCHSRFEPASIVIASPYECNILSEVSCYLSTVSRLAEDFMGPLGNAPSKREASDLQSDGLSYSLKAQTHGTS